MDTSEPRVKNTSHTTANGEKVLRLEIIAPVAKDAAWKMLSTAEGWRKWAAPVVSMDFRIGGVILTNYDEKKSVDDEGAIRLGIINYLEGELITLKVNLTAAFAEEVRQTDQNLQEIIQVEDLGNEQTRIISSMFGRGSGAEWDKVYGFFVKGNVWTFEQMFKAFA